MIFFVIFLNCVRNENASKKETAFTFSARQGIVAITGFIVTCSRSCAAHGECTCMLPVDLQISVANDCDIGLPGSLPREDRHSRYADSTSRTATSRTGATRLPGTHRLPPVGTFDAQPLAVRAGYLVGDADHRAMEAENTLAIPPARRTAWLDRVP